MVTQNTDLALVIGVTLCMIDKERFSDSPLDPAQLVEREKRNKEERKKCGNKEGLVVDQDGGGPSCLWWWWSLPKVWPPMKTKMAAIAMVVGNREKEKEQMLTLEKVETF